LVAKLVYRPAADPESALPFVACVHWPRSGHHLLVRLLQSILAERFGYCSFYGHEQDSRCCGAFPCERRGISFAKQHDFNFDCAVPAGMPLLVQYRRFDQSLIPSFEVRVSEGSLADTEADFRPFAVKRARLYRRFVDRWVKRDLPNRYVLTYSDLVEEPHAALLEILRLFGAEDRADRIDDAVATADHVTRKGAGRVIQRQRGVVNQTEVEAFRYFNRDFFACLDRQSDPFQPLEERAPSPTPER